jgi:hypothetical protein
MATTARPTFVDKRKVMHLPHIGIVIAATGLFAVPLLVGVALAANFRGAASFLAQLSGRLPGWFYQPRSLITSSFAWRLTGVALFAFFAWAYTSLLLSAR